MTYVLPFRVPLGRANPASYSPEPFLRLHSQMKIWLPVMMEVSQTAEVRTKMMKVLMKTSTRNRNPKWAKNSTRITKAVAVIATLIWKTLAMVLRKPCQSARRRNRRRLNDDATKHPANVSRGLVKGPRR